jgi:hypothetical protein
MDRVAMNLNRNAQVLRSLSQLDPSGIVDVLWGSIGECLQFGNERLDLLCL